MVKGVIHIGEPKKPIEKMDLDNCSFFIKYTKPTLERNDIVLKLVEDTDLIEIIYNDVNAVIDLLTIRLSENHFVKQTKIERD